jgi:hypothetical protein
LVGLKHGSRRFVLPVVFVSALVLSSSVQAAAVAFGSYLNESYARDAAAEVRANLGIDTRVVPTLISDVRYLRVLGPEGLSEQETRDLLARARANGYASAWYVAEPNP